MATDAETLKMKPSDQLAKKLTSWKKEPTSLQLKGDYDAAKPQHDAQMSKIRHWNDLMFVKGKAKPPNIKNRSQVQPKLIRRQAEWRYSALTEPFLGSNKIFKVEPSTFEDKAAAEQNELVLNWQFRTKLNRVKFIDDYVRTNVDEGTCIVRTGWKRATVMVKTMAPVYEHYAIDDEEQATLLQEAIAHKQENPREFDEQAPGEVKAAVKLFEETEQATYAVQVGEEEIETEKVLENKPTLEVLNPENVVIDPSCGGDLDKALFVVVSFETNKAELLKEKDRYKNLDAIDWENATPLSTPDHETKTPDNFNLSDKTRRKIVAYEYWGFYDIEGDGVLHPIIATWIGNTMIRMELNPYPDKKLPFVLVNYLPKKRDLYGEPDAELLEDNQAVLGAVTRGMIDLLGRSANSQQGVAKGMLDALNRKRFDEGRDYEFNPQQNPQSNLIEHKFPELPQSAITMVTMMNNEAESLTGVKSFGGGVSGEAYGDVAAGIRGVLDAASKREMAILRRLAKGMTEIGNKIIAMNAEFLSNEEVIRVTNSSFVTVKREDLEGNFDLEVDISTAEVDNQKSQDLAFMLQTIGNNMDPGIRNGILAEICKLKRMPDLAQKIANYKPEPTPEQKRLQELEIEKAEMEVEKLRSEVKLNEAKALAEAAKKDQANLDYVEQETGTKHARDMEKQRGQAEGNQDLEVTKALLKPTKKEERKPDVDAAIGYSVLNDKIRTAGQQAQPISTVERDVLAVDDPARNLGSMNFEPGNDPALNPAINI